MNSRNFLNAQVVFMSRLQKQGEAIADCQDFYAIDSDKNRYAVSDGVTHSFFPAELAQILVEYFCLDPSETNVRLFENKDWQAWLKPVKDKWQTKISAIVALKTGPHYAHLRNSLVQKEPAGATFIGLEFLLDSEQPAWRAMIIGDSCLFRLRGHDLNSYVITRSSQFDFHPEHFSSTNAGSSFRPQFIEGDVRANDVFILATDSLAKWILSKYEADTSSWESMLRELMDLNENKFVSLINTARYQSLEEDDVALVIIKLQTKYQLAPAQPQSTAPESSASPQGDLNTAPPASLASHVVSSHKPESPSITSGSQSNFGASPKSIAPVVNVGGDRQVRHIPSNTLDTHPASNDERPRSVAGKFTQLVAIIIILCLLLFGRFSLLYDVTGENALLFIAFVFIVLGFVAARKK